MSELNFGGQPGEAENLISVMYEEYGATASNTVIWYLLQDDNHDIVEFLLYMLNACGDEIAQTCAEVLENSKQLPELLPHTIDKLFGDEPK